MLYIRLKIFNIYLTLISAVFVELSLYLHSIDHAKAMLIEAINSQFYLYPNNSPIYRSTF
ncbi:hypothetical protein J5U22_01613 [Saccharolobus shibatae]|uniref:Uncharacterized protein n=1 Tax=Saccharolobus shibatae TaxID=2286 RepID=A0A8F5C115_9CREN|nr:hypothetical protein J5U22_01613 [Saccharolobus shibatae]